MQEWRQAFHVLLWVCKHQDILVHHDAVFSYTLEGIILSCA